MGSHFNAARAKLRLHAVGADQVTGADGYIGNARAAGIDPRGQWRDISFHPRAIDTGGCLDAGIEHGIGYGEEVAQYIELLFLATAGEKVQLLLDGLEAAHGLALFVGPTSQHDVGTCASLEAGRLHRRDGQVQRREPRLHVSESRAELPGIGRAGNRALQDERHLPGLHFPDRTRQWDLLPRLIGTFECLPHARGQPRDVG